MASDSPSELRELRDLVRAFVAERDWDKFHTPKNLAVSLSVEAGELLEPFQWVAAGSTDELTDAQLVQVRHEAADVLIYLIRLADKLGIELGGAVREKLELNKQKYPAGLVKGSARKYTEY
ncbi:nucleotide pyrophosphohydrolase [Dyella sp.]|uniref:nucleotide pyrophosphohydrolase n=1 Tax=Dyella sp. TaxID=1869338 RepID=UPI00284C5AAB|nr:nucleotide pyrophosphohydrolase [Dyella sp.]MDR3446928.1 nucleotide pyrophosphohydrolase [Dyella sp.]